MRHAARLAPNPSNQMTNGIQTDYASIFGRKLPHPTIMSRVLPVGLGLLLSFVTGSPVGAVIGLGAAYVVGRTVTPVYGALGYGVAALFKRKKNNCGMRILMVGLDAAGKTTILYKLKLGEVVTTIPIIGFNVKTVEYENISFTVWDVGCPNKTHRFWRLYYPNTGGLIFVVDSNDVDRIDAARDELHRMLNEDELRDTVLLVFANKQDRPNAMNAAEMTDKLGLHGLRPSYRQWYIQGCCATTEDGLYEGLSWLSATLDLLANV